MSNDNPNLQAGFEQQPPIVKNFYVQKLMPPLSSGENLKFTVEFYKESNIPNKLNIFKNQEISLVLKDDGIAPDAFANDFKYTAYMQQDIEAFKQDILKRQTKILADGGDTKSNFSMIYPRGYGEEANYWDVSAPTIVQPADILSSISPFSTQMDNSFNTQNNNSGQSFWRTSASTFGINPNSFLPEKTDNESNQIVSPFITGRRITKINGVVSWEDDEIDNTLSQETGLLNDMGFQGLFNVYDPSNNASTLKATTPPYNFYFPGDEKLGGEFPQLHDKKWGYNELLRRKKDLCQLIQGNCIKAKFELSELMSTIGTIPFPIGAH